MKITDRRAILNASIPTKVGEIEIDVLIMITLQTRNFGVTGYELNYDICDFENVRYMGQPIKGKELHNLYNHFESLGINVTKICEKQVGDYMMYVNADKLIRENNLNQFLDLDSK